jgi:hypothetical protein
MKSLNSAGAEARYLPSALCRKVDILVKTLLPSIHESSRDAGSLLLPILLRDWDEHGSIRIVGFCVDLLLAASPERRRRMYLFDDTGAGVGTVLRGVGSLLEDLLDHSLSSALFLPCHGPCHGDMKGIRGHTAESVKV